MQPVTCLFLTLFSEMEKIADYSEEGRWMPDAGYGELVNEF